MSTISEKLQQVKQIKNDISSVLVASGKTPTAFSEYSTQLSDTISVLVEDVKNVKDEITKANASYSRLTIETTTPNYKISLSSLGINPKYGSVTIDWDDYAVSTYNSQEIEHTYKNPGRYDIVIQNYLSGVGLPAEGGGYPNPNGGTLSAYSKEVKSMRFANDVKYLGSYYFKDCALTSVNLNNLSSAGDQPFTGSMIKEIDFANSTFTGRFSNCNYLCYNMQALTACNLPSTFVQIPSLFFQGDICLQTVKLPNTILSIENAAFRNTQTLSVLDMTSYEDDYPQFNYDPYDIVDNTCPIFMYSYIVKFDKNAVDAVHIGTYPGIKMNYNTYQKLTSDIEAGVPKAQYWKKLLDNGCVDYYSAKFTFQTTSNSTEVKIPLPKFSSEYMDKQIKIHWGDGADESFGSDIEILRHQFEEAGTYDVIIEHGLSGFGYDGGYSAIDSDLPNKTLKDDSNTLVNVSFSPAIKMLGAKYFTECKKISNLNVKYVDKLGQCILADATSIKSIELSKNLKSTDYLFFKSQLETCDVPSSYVTIPTQMFTMSKVKEVSIPSSVSSFINYTFFNSPNISCIDLRSYDGKYPILKVSAFDSNGDFKGSKLQNTPNLSGIWMNQSSFNKLTSDIQNNVQYAANWQPLIDNGNISVVI